jgi:preprotein translocase subunit SecY
MTAGTLLLVWMGELITQYGVGQGVSIIIFGGIIARLPDQILQSFAAGLDIGALLIFGILAVITVVAIIYVYEGQRRIPIQISKQIRGNRVFGGGTTHIPLKVNSAGMIALIFASSMLILPGTVTSCFVGSSIAIVATVAQLLANTFNPNGTNTWVYWLFYFILVVAFTFFYALVISNSRALLRTSSARTASSLAFVLADRLTCTCRPYSCESLSQGRSFWALWPCCRSLFVL